MPEQTDLARLWDMAIAHPELIAKSGALVPNTPKLNLFERFQRRRDVGRILKSIGEHTLISAKEESIRAAEQGAVVSQGMEAYGGYQGVHGVSETTGVTFNRLRQYAAHCEPIAAIIGTLVRRAGQYMQAPKMARGYVKEPGIHVRMRIPAQIPTTEDKVEMVRLQNFLLDCGVCDPPENEKPLNWQPGLRAFAEAFFRDSLTMDGAAMRRWTSVERGKDGKPKCAIASFCAIDSARIRKPARIVKEVRKGRRIFEPFLNERVNKKGDLIKFLEVSDGDSGGDIITEYTAAEVAYWVRNPRTDTEANGYGNSEVERCLDAISIWCAARQYNADRFRFDSLPRGILSIFGNMGDQQFQSFQLNWQQAMSGEGKRWFNPLIKANSADKSAVQWQPIDLSPRDMEYHQFMFTVALWCHAIFGIHPEETGFDAASPFRAALNEASPETKLEHGQDTCFAPLLKGFQDFLNREILWKIRPDRRYVVEFVGLGQGDEAADTELRAALLGAGLSTPRLMWAELDTPIPEELEDDPAMDMPGVWSANRQLLMQERSMEMQQKQQDAAAQQQQDAQKQQMAMGKMQQMQQMNQQEGEGEEAAGGGAPPDGGAPPGMGAPPGGGGMGLQKAIAEFLDPWGIATDRERESGKLMPTGGLIRITGRPRGKVGR